MCMDFQAAQVNYLVGTPYIGAGAPYKPGPGGNLGAFIAWDAANGKRVWEIKEKYPVWSGVVATAGSVVFYGTLDGWLKAADARTGALLWKFKVGSGVIGNPITFTGPAGKKYVAVYAGIGGDWLLLSGDVRSDDPADLRPAAPFMPGIAKHTSQGGFVWFFGLYQPLSDDAEEAHHESDAHTSRDDAGPRCPRDDGDRATGHAAGGAVRSAHLRRGDSSPGRNPDESRQG